MLAQESGADLFQRLTIKDESRYSELVDRLGRFFPNGFQWERGEFIEYLSNDRMKTKKVIHEFLRDYLELLKMGDASLDGELKEVESLSQSPQANKDSADSEIPILSSRFRFDRSVTFLYVDTEYQESMFNTDRIHWYDCETSTELIGTLLRFERHYFSAKPNEHFILIIDSTNQISINDYFHSMTSEQVLSIDESKQLTVEWHLLLIRLIEKYKISAIIIDYLDVDLPLIFQRDERTSRRNSKNKDFGQSLPDLSFARLMNNEHYFDRMKIHFDYRQIQNDEA